jgi:hypothetical protein
LCFCFHPPIMAHKQAPSTADTLVPSASSISKRSRHAAVDYTLQTTKSPVIPPEHPFRTLVICFDGTGDVRFAIFSALLHLSADIYPYSNSIKMQASSLLDIVAPS